MGMLRVNELILTDLEILPYSTMESITKVLFTWSIACYVPPDIIFNGIFFFLYLFFLYQLTEMSSKYVNSIETIETNELEED